MLIKQFDRFAKYFRLAVLSAVVLATLATACYANEPTKTEVETRFAKLLRNTKISSIRPSVVKGLYEITAGPNVFYYSPEGKGYLLFGQILDSEGANLTAEIQNKLRVEFQAAQDKRAAEIVKTLPLEKAIKTGSGPNVVIEFTDVDCPYCRKMDNFLAERSDVTRYTFFFPLDQIHPNARAKSLYVLTSKDKEKALKEAFSGKLDSGALPITNADFDKYPVEMQQLLDGIAAGQKLGVQGTPYLFVNGAVVNGADINKVTQLLNKKK